jgi:hypothetical protein
MALMPRYHALAALRAKTHTRSLCTTIPHIVVSSIPVILVTAAHVSVLTV